MNDDSSNNNSSSRMSKTPKERASNGVVSDSSNMN
jgi:hypothetical protein